MEEFAMGTLAEDIERTRGLYQSIKTPWKRPRFPDPPTEFLAPEKFLELAKEAVLVHHTKINHPFCVKLFRGEWTLKQLRSEERRVGKEWRSRWWEDK